MPSSGPLQRVTSFTKELFQNYGNDDAFTLGAALAYYTVFSFAPLLVIIISVAGYFVGPEAIRGELFGQLKGLLGADAASSLQTIIENAYVSGKGTLATITSAAALILGATGVFNALHNSLNRIWEIAPNPDNTILAMIRTRILSFSFVLGLGFLLLVTLVLNAVVIGFTNKLAGMVPGIGPALLGAASMVLSLILTSSVFALLFKYLPDARARWQDVWAGGIFTALLFSLGKYLIGFYIGNSDFSSTYGAAGALITLLVWTYYSSQILFLGAEFTFVWAKRNGHPIQPSSDAVRVIRKTETIDR